MKADGILDEMYRVKDELGEKFSWDVRAICNDLIRAQQIARDASPLVADLPSSLRRQAERIRQLPGRPPVESFLSEDPIIAEVRNIRAKLDHERESVALHEKPPKYGGR
jgi:hypothetical protein